MGKDLDELTSYFEPLAERLLDLCANSGIPCAIERTGTTPEEQAVELAAGRSWTHHSKHLPQPPENKSEAIDIVPLAILKGGRADYDPSNVFWQRIGIIGESLGLTWGGRFPVNQPYGDPGHFQYKAPRIPLHPDLSTQT